jgi:hypothetical protein
MRHEEGIEESFAQIRVTDVMSKPGEDPRQTKEGFHLGLDQMPMNGRVDPFQQGKYDQPNRRLQPSKVCPQRITKVTERRPK